MSQPGGVIVGIDLGTTNSLVAVCDARGPRVLRDRDGRGMLPSVVRYQPGGPPIVGSEAKSSAGRFPKATVSSVKRLMGRSVKDASGDLAFLPYDIVPGERDSARVRLADEPGEGVRLLSPEEVSAEILRRLRDIASEALGAPVTRAVITVPAYFDDAQRQATRTAGRLAGLDVVRLVPEPTAAALAYGIGLSGAPTPRTVVVYDLGGGTFDVSVLRLIPGEGEEPFYFQVLGVGGDTRLGGDDFDHLLVEIMDREIRATRETSGAAIAAARRADLLAAAERAKIRLSDDETAGVSVDLGDGTTYERIFTRAEYEALIEPLVARTIDSCRATLGAARNAMQGEQPGAVVLVGGATRTPLVRRRVAEHFGVEPYTALNPDEVVALGAAVQAQVLAGDRRDTLLLDVIPLSLGLETTGGAVAKLVMRNSTVPARATEMFSTQADNQTGIRLTVYQGEREMAEHCRRLGEFHLRGLPPMPAGLPQVEVEFLVDANGVLSVSAHERRSGKRARFQVVPNHGLSADEVSRIEQESVTHAREDMTRHRVVDLIANSTLDLKWVSEGLARHRGALDAEYAAEIDRLLAELRSYCERARADWRGVDVNGFSAAKDTLDRASMRLQEVSIAASLRGPRPA